MRYAAQIAVVGLATMFGILVGAEGAHGAEALDDTEYKVLHRAFTFGWYFQNKHVRADLSTTLQQVAEIDDWIEESRAAKVERSEKSAAASKEDRAAIEAGRATFERELDAGLIKILRPEQVTRLLEIARRSLGPRIFDKEYRARFELSLAQQLKFDEMLDELRVEYETLAEEFTKLTELPGTVPVGERASVAWRKLRAADERSLLKMVALLTPQQKKLFEKQRGKDFDLARFDAENLRLTLGGGS